jgi:hypothetical protein
MGLPAVSSAARTSSAARASSSSNGTSSSGPAKKVSSRCRLACLRALLAAPYHSSNATTAETATLAPSLRARSRRGRTFGGAPLMSAMHALVSSR